MARAPGIGEVSATSPEAALLLCVGAYLVGSIPVPWLLGRVKYGLDIRRFGTGNVGTSNLYRHAGFSVAALSGPIQFAQGLLPVLLVRRAGAGESVAVIAGLIAVIGNGWPVWLGFDGGRGIAVATGAVAGVHPAGLAVLLCCYAVGALRHAIALGVFCAFAVLPIAALLLGDRTEAIGSVALLILILWRRLTGLAHDHQTYGEWRHLFMERLLYDRRPGRPLVGQRSDTS
ncbi:MAG TPA: glycerol-3-phosphate acyltransferase [Candidatus Sulfotelmatobacter sp.]|nr:glycerol-3-phosphate acyltransferase [Candidatus Sulfotelmatobacter sp.]